MFPSDQRGYALGVRKTERWGEEHRGREECWLREGVTVESMGGGAHIPSLSVIRGRGACSSVCGGVSIMAISL